jgi:hypothetical protein
MTCPVAASLSSSFRVCNRGRRHGVLNDRLDLPHAVQRPANKLLDSLERHHCTDTELAVAFSAEHVANCQSAAPVSKVPASSPSGVRSS